MVGETRCYLSVTQKEELPKEALCTLGVGCKWPKPLPKRKKIETPKPYAKIMPNLPASGQKRPQRHLRQRCTKTPPRVVGRAAAPEHPEETVWSLYLLQWRP